MIATTKKIIDEFTLGYIYSALWELQGDFDIKDISPIYLREVIDDCREFQEQYKQLLNEFYSFSEKIKKTNELVRILPEHLGHDYWLARNGLDFDFVKRAPLELVQQFQFSASRRGEQKLIMEGSNLKFLNAA
jgi:hypothetical protein